MNETELTNALTAHALWLLNATTGKRLNAEGRNFSGMDLRKVDFSMALLAGAKFTGCSLNHTNFSGADLRETNFTGSVLVHANFNSADLRGANLEDTCCESSRFASANLKGAKLYKAGLSGAVIDNAILPEFTICPKEGEFFAYKKVFEGAVLKLLIPTSARRNSSLVGRKCRASEAHVVEVFDGLMNQTKFHSTFDHSFTYEVGKTSTEPNYSDDIRQECVPGIHFFMTFDEAKEY
jgi:hypothetical protein